MDLFCQLLLHDEFAQPDKVLQGIITPDMVLLC